MAALIGYATASLISDNTSGGVRAARVFVPANRKIRILSWGLTGYWTTNPNNDEFAMGYYMPGTKVYLAEWLGLDGTWYETDEVKADDSISEALQVTVFENATAFGTPPRILDVRYHKSGVPLNVEYSRSTAPIFSGESLLICVDTFPLYTWSIGEWFGQAWVSWEE